MSTRLTSVITRSALLFTVSPINLVGSQRYNEIPIVQLKSEAPRNNNPGTGSDWYGVNVHVVE